MALTRSQARDYIRAICGEQDFANLKDTLVNQFINFGIRQVQNDLINLGMKVFTKQKTLGTSSGSVVAVPSDCLALPNAIIDIKASTGTRSYGTQAFTIGSVTITVLEPGASEWTITFTNDTGYTTPAVTAFDISAKTVTIKMKTAVTTGTQLSTLATTDPVLSTYLSFSYSITTAITLNSSSVAVATTNEGTGTGWQPAEECSIEDWNRLSTNTYLAPTTTNIIYKRNGDYNGSGTIEFLPSSVTYAYIYYYYKLADLSSDSSSLPFPDEYEELLLTAVAIKCYSRLKFMAGVSEKAQEYLTKLQSLNNDYKNLLNDRVADKTRLLSDDPKD